MLSVRSVLLLSTLTAVLGGAAGAGTLLVLQGGARGDATPDDSLAGDAGGTALGGDIVRGADTAAFADTDTDTDGSVAVGDDAADPQAFAGRAPSGAALATALDDAAAERSQLAATLVDLSRELEVIEQAIAAFNLPGGEAAGGEDAQIASDFSRLDGMPRGARSGMDTKGLLAAGVDPSVSAELARRNDAWQLARLALVDRAAREGWDDSDELDRQLEQLNAERPDLRDELGDERYDDYLYAAERPNRVAVASVIPGGAADQAGLRENDVLLSYAGETLYDIQSLQRATRSGTLGEAVTLDVLRADQTLQVTLARGPLGVSLAPVRREP